MSFGRSTLGVNCSGHVGSRDTDMAILSSKGVKPEMKFVCCDCTEIISGQRVIEGEHLHIVAANRVEPEKSEFRCECCQDDWEEKFG